MAIIKDDDCIAREDGTLICWDREDECFLLLNKQKITTADISKDELAKLIALMGKPRQLPAST
jgi:hypothetical protein